MPDAATKAPRVSRENRSSEQGKGAEIEVHHGAGIDLPVVGHVSYRSLGLYGGLVVAGTVGVLEWPVAGAIGVVYGLTRK